MTTKRLSVQGLRELVKEEFSRARGRRPLREDASAFDWESPAGASVSDAIRELAAAVIDYHVGDDIENQDEFMPEVHNDILACVEKISNEYDWGQGLEDQSAVDRGVY
jgi:hypothetical protein